MDQALYELPVGWEWSTLEEQTIPTKNIKPTSAPKQQFTYIDISSIDRNINQITDPKIIFGSEAPSRAKKEVFENDVLFATTRPNLKNIAMFSGGVESPVASTGFCVLRAVESIEPNFIFRFLTTEFLQQQITPLISGAQYPAITDKNLKLTPIPVPPLDEQKRIVAKLEALFTCIDTAITQLQQTIELTSALFASALDGEFSGPANRLKVSEIADVKGGKRLPKGNRLQDELSNHPYIRVADFTNAGSINVGGVKYISDEIYQQIKRYTITSKDLYISIAGTIGKTGIIPEELNGANLTENAAKLVFKEPNNIDVTYIYYFTLSHDFSEQVGLATKVVAQPKLALTRLSKIKIPVPQIEMQQQIVANLDTLAEHTRALETVTKEKLNELTTLKASLLDAAFKGQL